LKFTTRVAFDSIDFDPQPPFEGVAFAAMRSQISTHLKASRVILAGWRFLTVTWGKIWGGKTDDNRRIAG
jgi:hypothetical protein